MRSWGLQKRKSPAGIDRLGWVVVCGGMDTACLKPLFGGAHLLSADGFSMDFPLAESIR